MRDTSALRVAHVTSCRFCWSDLQRRLPARRARMRGFGVRSGAGRSRPVPV